MTALALSPDGVHLAAGYEKGMIKIWNFETKQCKVSLNGHKSSVSCLSFNSSSSILVSGSLDTHLVVWDLLAERGVARLKGHKTRITQCAIVESSERGNFVISSSLDGMLKVWNLEIYQVCPSSSKIDRKILNFYNLFSVHPNCCWPQGRSVGFCD